MNNELMCVCSVEGINSHGINGIQIPKRNKFFGITDRDSLLHHLGSSASWQLSFLVGFNLIHIDKS
ncbi:hypothetical protein [Neobacillus sp. SuZ13]|uniref:hypothetical protein n=1 Tax=Neobacillus sp. SuZ13 TaxID=3047875 RepID=UPI0024C0B53A|nr:hypothetical protein [Neobacillus sp. SuZ13]WHY65232.1 hypothetical protein QNH17_19330 [Neobacillus sp. SuZ13]